MAFEKQFVYVLRNGSTPRRYYTGLTSNVAARLTAHNTGHCTHVHQAGNDGLDVILNARSYQWFLHPGLRRLWATDPSALRDVRATFSGRPIVTDRAHWRANTVELPSRKGRIRSAERVEAHQSASRLRHLLSARCADNGRFDERRSPCRSITQRHHARFPTVPISAI